MGEYALYRRRRIKIGTCEDLLYLRDHRFSAQSDRRAASGQEA